MVNLKKDDLFVLHALWESKARLTSFYAEPEIVALGFNIPCTPICIRDSVVKLLHSGMVQIERSHRSAKNNIFIEKDFIGYTCDINGLSIGLTKIGGKAWEHYFSPPWHEYVSGVDFDENMGGHYFRAFDWHRVTDVVKNIEEASRHPGNIELSLKVAWRKNIIYWKNACGYQASFFTPDGFYCDMFDFDKYNCVYEVLDAQQEFNAFLSKRAWEIFDDK